MRSNNPVFTRSPEFNGRGAGAQHGSYSDPSGWGVAQGGGQYGAPEAPTSRMTVDSVVQKTAFSVGTVIVVALATWILTPTPTNVDPGAIATLGGLAGIGALLAFGLSLVNSFKKVVSPALVMAFAVVEGVALGALSKMFDVYFGGNVVTGAVIGTFGAFAGTLAAYKFFEIKVGEKFRMGVIAGMFGMVGLGLMSFVLSFFGIDTGLFGFGTLGMLMSIAGLVLGVFMLILDFDFVEQGVAAGLDERESWRAAFAMTVSLVWIYTNLLRLLAIFSSD